MIEIVLGWPPSDLSPNKRLHWAKLAAAKKQYRKNCMSASREQLADYLGERVMDRLRENGGALIGFNWDSYRKNL